MSNVIEKVQDVADEVTGFARAVAAKRAAIVGAVTFALALLADKHVITPDLSNRVNGWIVGGLAVAGFIGSITWIHFGVTPANPALGPKASDGTVLVQATVAAQAAHAAYQAGASTVSDDLNDADVAAAAILGDQPAADPAGAPPAQP